MTPGEWPRRYGVEEVELRGADYVTQCPLIVVGRLGNFGHAGAARTGPK
jgi:hypothetical protein